jgi:hypothetical protein
MKTHKKILLAAATLAVAGCVQAAEVTGNWTAAFESRVGPLKYLYAFKADGEQLTGTASRTLDSETTKVELKEGKLTGDGISFVEPLKYEQQDIRIEYKGKVAGDEIKFTPQGRGFFHAGNRGDAGEGRAAGRHGQMAGGV